MGKIACRRGLALPCIAGMLLLAACSSEQKQGASAVSPQAAALPLQVESFKMGKTDSLTAEGDVTVTVKALVPHKPVYLTVNAKSRDGVAYVEGPPGVAVTAGQHVHVHVTVLRPFTFDAVQTDHLIVSFYQTNPQSYGHIISSNHVRLEWKHDWPRSPYWIPPSTIKPPLMKERVFLSPYDVFSANWRDEDFPALDVLLGEWNHPGVRDVDGAWKLDGFTQVLDEEMAADMKGSIARVRGWQASSPNSPGAAIAEARYWYNDAWHILGCRCHRAEKPDPFAVKIFNQRMEKAENALLDSRDYAANNPIWYEIYLNVAIDRHHSDVFIDKLFQEAVKKFPDYPPLYAAMARRWTPDGPGPADWGKVDALVRQAVSQTQQTEGLQNYARIYVQISQQQQDMENLLEISQASWQTMRASFQEMLKRYPSVDNLNEFASFACRVGDKETYLTLMPRLNGHIDNDIWPGNYSVDLCNHRFMETS